MKDQRSAEIPLALETQGTTVRWAGYSFVLASIATLGVLDALFFVESGWIGWVTAALIGPTAVVAALQIVKPTPTTRNKDEFITKRSSWAAISYLLLCSGWLIAGLLILTHKPETAWLSFTFSYLCAFGILISLWQFFDQRPLLRINDQGYYDRMSGMGMIPWSAIRGAQIISKQGTELILLELKDPGTFLSKRSLWQRFNSRVNKFMGFELMHLGLVRMQALYIDEALDFILARCASQTEEDKYAALSELV